jgi:hypothetical protein
MGSEVLYCYKCQRRLVEADFGRGEAMKVGSLSTCADCADALLARLTPEQRKAALARVTASVSAEDRAEPGRTTAHLTAGQRTTASLRGGRSVSPGLARKPVALYAAIGAGGAILLVLAFAALGGNKEKPLPDRPAPAPTPVAPAPRPPRSPERIEAATPVDVKRERDGLAAMLATLESDVRGALERKDFGAALARLEGAGRASAEPEIAAAAQRRLREVREAVAKEFEALRARAVAAKEAGNAGAVREARESVSRWGIPAHVEALQAALAAVPPSPPPGTALRLSFDESGGAEAKDAAGGAPGTIRGEARRVPGRLGSALHLNGVDAFVLVPDRPALNPDTALTIAVWVDADDWFGHYRIAQKGGGDNQYRLTRETQPTTGMLFEIKEVGSVMAPIPAAEGWHHLAATYDGSTLRIYWNGVCAAQAPASGRIPRTGDALCVGSKREGAPAGDYFKGKLDDLLIVGRALTAAEILALAGRE